MIWTKQAIRALRTSFNWTQVEMAEQMGVTKSTVARWEQGVKKPSTPSQRLLTLLKERERDSL